MLVTQQPVLRRFWYGLMPLSDLADGPKPFTLLGENIVVWLDPNGKPAAVQDRCCHRTAPLSLGFVENGAIVCGYHGWTFDRDGKCIRIPQQATVGPRIRVQSYRCEERYGYVWVCLGEPLTGIPEVPEFGQPGYRFIHEFSDAWDCNVLRLIENAFDNAHFSYIHAASFGNQAQPEPASLTIAQNPWGFVMDTVVPVQNTENLKATLRMDETETMRTYQKTWWMPFSVMMRLSYPNGLVHVIVAMITPVDDKRLKFSQFVLRNDSEAEVPAEKVIAWDRQVTGEDRRILSRCEWDVALDMRAPDEFHMASDRPGLEVRRRLLDLLRQHGESEVRLSGKAVMGAEFDGGGVTGAVKTRFVIAFLALTAGLAAVASASAQCKGADRAVEQKLTLGAAPSETLVSLRITLCTRHEFKLVLESGQRVELTLTSPSGQQGMVTLMAPSGQKPADGENSWSGAVKESGIYTLEVATDFSTSYTLKVAVR